VAVLKRLIGLNGILPDFRASSKGVSLGQGIRRLGQYVAGYSNTGAYYSGFAQAMQRNCLFIRSAKNKGDRESEVTYVKKSVLS
jgi:hypothetical protein